MWQRKISKNQTGVDSTSQTKRLRKFGLRFLVFLIILVSILYFLRPVAQADVQVDTSTVATATAHSYQRKTWHDGTRYWAAFLGGTTSMEFWYSADGTTWTQNTAATISGAAAVEGFAIEADSTNAYIIHDFGSTIAVQKADLYPGTSFKWAPQVTVWSGGTYDNPVIERNRAGKVRVMVKQDSAGNHSFLSKLSTGTNDVSSFGSEETVDAASANSNKFGTLVALDDQDMYAVWIDGTAIEGKKNTNGTWDVSPTSIATGVTGVTNNMSMVSNPTVDEAYLTYMVSGDTVEFKKYVDGTGWGSAVAIDSTTGGDYPTIAMDTNSKALYILWVRSDDIFYKKGVGPYASTDWDSGATTLVSTGTGNHYLSTASQEGGGKLHLIWTQGTGSPWSVRFESIEQTPPLPATLSAPAAGAISVSTQPQFQLSTTDGDSDFLRYEIIVYQSNCSTVVRTIDQNSSQTGWTGQDADSGNAYASGTMATHNYQTPALAFNTTYCWKGRAKDPSGSNTWGSYSATRTFTTNQTPAAPTLGQPANSATSVLILPEFRLSATDPDSSDYLQYWIDVCSTSDCSSIVRSICQTNSGTGVPGTCGSPSQTGWFSQSLQSVTAYASGQIAVHQYQPAALSANTQYWWRAYVIDPGGTNTWSSASAISTFTTGSATPTMVKVLGGTSILGGTKIAN